MPRRKRLIVLALAFQGFQFACHVKPAFPVIAVIERDYPDGVAGYEVFVPLHIIKCKGEYPVQFVQKAVSLLPVEGKYDLAITSGRELVPSGISPADILMVVNLPVDGQHLLHVRAE